MSSLPDAPPRHAIVPFTGALAAHGDRLAVATRDGELSYRELAARVEDVARRLGHERRLVLVAGANEVGALVGYLAALSAGHPVLLVPGDNPAALDAMVAAYDPDVVVRGAAGACRVDELREGCAHDLHPDLALLLSTSGSTGSPKLVRLSHANVQSNAEAIAEYLAIRATDRAATTLPMHYCYGLSVVNSHLLSGAGLILTDRSVVDTCFWDLFRDKRATAFAGVPYTFDLLDRVGFAEMHLPHLRYVTQAGGRLAPDRVLRYAQLGRARGWDLFVMYGQTEATARMAYLPPDLAASHPGAIGVPIPGGSFTLAPLPDDDDDQPDTGELVYAGPNVMLGYAHTPADLGLGRTVDVLRTGDVARRTGDGLYEVVGRLSRFVKVFGLRIDLQRAEAIYAEHGLTVCCAGSDDALVVAVEGGAGDDALVRRVAVRTLGLPAGAVRVLRVPELPRLPSGKPDHRAVAELAEIDRNPPADLTPTPAPASAPATAADPAALRALYAEVLERSDVSDDSTFVGLGGDSLSYVELSVRLEELLGHLPTGWHTTPIRDLTPAPRRRWTRWRSIETSVILRAVAIVLIVGTHAHLFGIPGSAHVLVAVAGFNFARFQMTSATRRRRLRGQLRSIVRIALPAVAWIALAYVALTDDYALHNVLLLNAIVGPETWTVQWHFWFLEVLLYILLALALVMAIPRVDRAERRFPFGFALALVSLGLLTRFDLVDVGILNTRPVFWLFALGWAAARATTAWQRALLMAVVAAAVPGFFDDLQREAILAGGIALLIWVPSLRCPAALSRAVTVLASASLYIYVTHWQVYPYLREDLPLLAVAASLGVGILYWMVATPMIGKLASPRIRRRFAREAVGTLGA